MQNIFCCVLLHFLCFKVQEKIGHWFCRLTRLSFFFSFFIDFMSLLLSCKIFSDILLPILSSSSFFFSFFPPFFAWKFNGKWKRVLYVGFFVIHVLPLFEQKSHSMTLKLDTIARHCEVFGTKLVGLNLFFYHIFKLHCVRQSRS